MAVVPSLEIKVERVRKGKGWEYLADAPWMENTISGPDWPTVYWMAMKARNR